MEECLIYFRQLVADPLSVPPWSEWWAANEAVVERTFSLTDYVRLKHRRLRGALQILERRGELPEEFRPPTPQVSGICYDGGERVVVHPAGPGGGWVECPVHGRMSVFDSSPAQ